MLWRVWSASVPNGGLASTAIHVSQCHTANIQLDDQGTIKISYIEVPFVSEPMSSKHMGNID